MYVQCERCKTDYEFDDALVSERGTTVKCTSCGHQFKVYRRGAPGETGEDRWVVTLRDGKQLLFTSMKELQRAILAHQVGRNDTLARGGAPPRRLGAIAELEPFLDQRLGAESAQRHTKTTRPPPPTDTALTAPPPPRDSPSRRRVDTLRPGGDHSALPPPQHMPPTATIPVAAVVPAAAFPEVDREEPQQDSVRTQVGVGPAPPTFDPPQDVRAPPGLAEAPTRPAFEPAEFPRSAALADHRAEPRPAAGQPYEAASPRAGGPGPGFDELGSPAAPPAAPRAVTAFDAPARRAMPSYDDHEAPRARLHSASFDEPVMQGRPSRLGGWVLGFVLLAGMSAVALYVVRPDFTKLTRPAASASPLDPRAQQFLTAGEAALAQGNLEGAKENFDKASALAEKDPKVLVDVARLATIRADLPWLKQRLLPPDSTEIAATKAALDDLGAKAKRATEDATKIAPDDLAAQRIRVDALRIAGDRDAARALVRTVASNPTQPDGAYVLAALDLAEIDPPWAVVVERLRTAAADDTGAGRGRAALVYALARSGDVAAARQELDRMSAAAQPHPLLPLLRAFVDRTPSARDGGAPATSTSPAIGSSTATAPVGSVAAGTPGSVPGDPRQMILLAEAAKNRRDFPRARALFNAALSKNGSDSEALSGLADVAHAQHDLQSALIFYKRALTANPTYLPALTGKADTEWEMGDRGVAAKDYKDIADRFPDGSYPPRVKERAGEAAPPTTAPTSSPSTTAVPPASAPPTAAPLPTLAPTPLTSAAPSPAPTSDPPTTGGTP